MGKTKRMPNEIKKRCQNIFRRAKEILKNDKK